MRLKLITLIAFLLIFAYGCDPYKIESTNNYNGWIVVQKPYSNLLVDGYVKYSFMIQKKDSIKQIYISEFYFNKYKLGDTLSK